MAQRRLHAELRSVTQTDKNTIEASLRLDRDKIGNEAIKDFMYGNYLIVSFDNVGWLSFGNKRRF